MDLKQRLNRQIADWSVIYVKLHNYHWYVTGEQFFTLHAKFEELYNEAALHVDNIAERLLALGGRPYASMRDYLSVSSVEEASGSESARDMVQSLVGDYTRIIAELKEGMAEAEAAGDETTADLLLSIHAGLEKHVWMLNSFLGR